MPDTGRLRASSSARASLASSGAERIMRAPRANVRQATFRRRERKRMGERENGYGDRPNISNFIRIYFSFHHSAFFFSLDDDCCSIERGKMKARRKNRQEREREEGKEKRAD